ncbi:DNRLRE domain-containing protein, partial [Paenibacillus sepulcri]|nr:DNRLRE domain-containing protein [Paenibacillus sepulcri]
KVTSADGESSRTYKITVNKSAVVLQQGVGGYSGQKDVHLSEGKHKAKNTGQHNMVEVGNYDPLMADRKFGLFQFDISSLPADADITEAKLELNLAGTRGRTDARFDKTLFLYEALGNWDEGTGIGFDGTDGSAGVIWDTMPAYATEALDSQLVASVNNTWYEWEITDLLKEWKDGGKTNYGMLLKAEDSTSDATTIPSTKDFASAQNSNATIRPKLAVNYTLPLQGIKLDDAALALTVGQVPVKVVSFIRPLNAETTGLQWLSDDESVAT